MLMYFDLFVVLSLVGMIPVRGTYGTVASHTLIIHTIPAIQPAGTCVTTCHNRYTLFQKKTGFFFSHKKRNRHYNNTCRVLINAMNITFSISTLTSSIFINRPQVWLHAFVERLNYPADLRIYSGKELSLSTCSRSNSKESSKSGAITTQQQPINDHTTTRRGDV